MFVVAQLSRRGLLKRLVGALGLTATPVSQQFQLSGAGPTISSSGPGGAVEEEALSVRWQLGLNGGDWTLASFQPGEGMGKRAFAEGYPMQDAIPATVPGDIHGDLERAHKLPEIYYGMNSRETQWVSEREWWYRKSFSLPADQEGRTAWLRFDGVDYLADIWLNGQWLVQHEGQFTPFELEVSRWLRYGTENVLVVLIHPVPPKVGAEIAKWSNPALYGSQSGEWPVMQAMRDAYPYWKSMTSSGWDWGTKIISMGIWKDVRLITSRNVYISRILVRPKLLQSESKARLSIQLTTRVSKQTQVKLIYRVRSITSKDAPALARQTVSLASGTAQVEFEMEIQNPRLWWPNGYGAQNLYGLEVTALNSEREEVLDCGSTAFGIRDLGTLVNPSSPDNVEYVDYSTGNPILKEVPQPPPKLEYLITINGRRIFARGANWIPCDLLFGRPRGSFYEHLISLAASANFNLLRVWGGGLIEKEEFYDLCDRYGIMLFQEFPNAGPRLPETDPALATTARETGEVLPLLINHPSIVRYGGGNEWYCDSQSSRQMAQLRKICNATDPSRPFHDPDPEVVAQRHGPHSYNFVRHYKTFNSGHPLTSGPDDPVEWTEYGAAGASSADTLKRIMPEDHLWPISSSDPYWIWHKAFHAFGVDNWLGSSQYTQLFGEMPDLDTAVRCSQFLQAEGLRYANQAMRRTEWHRSACAFWTYNEPWPNAAHGCVVEYSGRPKMAYYYVRQTYAALDIGVVYPGLFCTPEKPFRLPLFVSSDSTTELREYGCRYRIYRTDGECLGEGSSIITIPPESSTVVSEVTWTPPASLSGEVILLNLELMDPHGTVVARNLYTFAVGTPGGAAGSAPFSSAPLRGLLRAPATKIRLSVDRGREVDRQGGRFPIEVENAGPHPALFVTLEADAGDGIRLHFEDNYLFLAPGERRKTSVSLGSHVGKPPRFLPAGMVRAKAWNSDQVVCQEA